MSLTCPRSLLSIRRALPGLLAALTLPSFAALPTSNSTIAINHVNVIDATGSPAQDDMLVVIKGSRIAAITHSAGAAVPPGAKLVDGSGKFLIPGLWDMHVHTIFGEWVPENRDVTLPLFVANGITGVRDMGGDLPALKVWRSAIAKGSLLGPRMVIAGPMLDGPIPHFPSSAPVKDAAAGRKVVDDLVREGVDFIKIQSYIPRDGYFAAAREAKRLHIPFVGHVPDVIRASEASNLGQKSIEHFTGIFEACSTDEDALLKGGRGPGRSVTTYNADRAKAIIALMARNQTWQVPTLVWERGQWLIDKPDIYHADIEKYAPVAWREKTWPMFTKSILAEMDTDPLPQRERYVQMEFEMVKQMRDAGVPFLAGTDTAAGVSILPGFSLHEELEIFVEAGMTPMEALQTATLNPARFLGRTRDLGTVSSGKLADLVLLDANPLEDIHNTRKIAAVVLAGRYLDRAALDGMLSNAEAAAAKAH